MNLKVTSENNSKGMRGSKDSKRMRGSKEYNPLLEQLCIHPCLLIVPVIKAKGFRILVFEASRTLEPTDKEDGEFFGPSCIAEKSKSDAEFVFFLAAHLLRG